MYLKNLKIRNFRAIADLDLTFLDGVNVLIGENNAGKSAVLDALRICLSYGSSWRDLSIDYSDFFVDRLNCTAPPREIQFHLTFEMTNPDEAGWFHDLHAVSEAGAESLEMHFRFFIEDFNGVTKIRRRIWGGANEGQIIDPEVLDMFYYVYLEALRDAVDHLRPVRGSKIGQLFLNLVTDDNQRGALSGKVRTALNEDQEWKAVVDDGKEKINEHLLATSIRGKEQDISLDFLPFEFKRIVESLRMQMPVYKSDILNGDPSRQKYFDLYQNGLGYNNLLYTATVLGHLKQRAAVEPRSYMALLIEEPEAHLHPQLQNIFFKYLNILNRERFQVFISSHSPTITAKADLHSLVVLQRQGGRITALPVSRSDLSIDNRRYLQKFLDVTKCQLFFANGVILVEGISEALLLPVFSKIMGEEFDLEKAGVEIVNINGVAFEHFARLFNSTNEHHRLAAPCAIITDDDRGALQDGESTRAQNALDLQGGSVSVFLGRVTFEYELFIGGNNKNTLLGIFREFKPRAAENIEEGDSLDSYALSFVEKVRANKAKSELAHRLAIHLDENEALRNTFIVPTYIQDAIRWAVNR